MRKQWGFLKWGIFVFVIILIALSAAPHHASHAQDGGTPPPRELPEPINVNPPLQGAALIGLAQSEGTVRVIIELNTGFVPEGQLINPAFETVATSEAVAVQREMIADTQTALLNQMDSYNFDILTQWEGLPGLAATTDAAGLQALLASPLVRSVTEDIALPRTMGYTLPLINASDPGGAWEMGVDGDGFVVAILDTGTFSNHEFLSGKVVAEACFSSNYGTEEYSLCPGGATSATGPGAASPFARCVALTGDPSMCDHGTHVAGTAAGNWGYYTAPTLIQPINMGGVARGADIIAIQVFTYFTDADLSTPGNQPDTMSYTSDQISALNYVYNTLASVGPGAGSYNISSINLSLGGGYSSEINCDSLYAPMLNALSNLRSVGIAPAVASGNNGYVDAMNFPGCVSAAVSVGATETNYLSGPVSTYITPNWPTNAWCATFFPGTTCYGSGVEKIAYFSNGSPALDLLAPGFYVESSVIGSNSSITNRYDAWPGTSMATPHVAGAWAVLKQQSPVAPVNRILTTLQNTGVSITDSAYTGNSGWPPTQVTLRSGAPGTTFKRIDLGAAVLELGRDFGDAPNTYATLNASNGARHIRVPEYYLGTGADSEADGTPSVNDGDEGVSFPSMAPGATINLSVTASVAQAAGIAPNSTYLGRLYGWMDLNADGDFADPGEQVVNSLVLTGPYPQNVSITLPAGASVGTTWARFRYSTQTGLSYNGQAYNGEVEDYQISLVPPTPEIEVEGHSAIAITDEGSYNMGSSTLGTALARTITIRNTGSAALILSGSAPNVTGDFSAGNFGTTSVAPGSSTTFTLTCLATTTGSPVNGTISFGTNDNTGNENPFNFTVACTVTAPEIEVEGHGAVAITDSGTYDMGTTPLGVPLVRTITVRNTGNATLNLTNNPPSVTGNFSAGTFASTAIASGSYTTFSLTCSAAAQGTPVNGTVSFGTNDNTENENPFNFTVRCNVVAPEIEVEGPGPVAITDGGTYSLGNTTLGVPITHTITVRNVGPDPLTLLTNPPTVGAHFTTWAFGSTTIAAGESTTFDLRCNADVGGAPVSATVSFNNDDGNENPFNFTATCNVTAPEISVEGPGSVSILKNGMYNLGTTNQGTPLVRTITVRNIGDGPLTITTNPPTVPAGFSATNFGATTVAPSASTTFDLTCNATTTGTSSGTLSFDNNDTDENPFNFTVICTVIAPEIVVEAPGGSSIALNGSYNLGTVALGGELTRTITVRNTGTAALTLITNPPTVTGDFTAGSFGTTSVAAGSFTTFNLTCNGSALGTANGSVRFFNNDSDENDYFFNIACQVIDPIDPPALLLPAEGALTNDNTPVFTWSAVTNAEGYDIQVDNSSAFDSLDQIGSVTGTSFTGTVVLADNTIYYWRVRTVGAGGVPSAWSVVRSFKVDLLRPTMPALGSPSDRSKTTDTTPTFSWSRPSGATQFHVEVDNDPAFGSPVNLGATLFTSTSFTPLAANALPYDVYYWRVQAGNAANLWSDWSVVRRFTVTLLTAPANTAHLTDTTPTLTWSKPAGTLGFEYQVNQLTPNNVIGSPTSTGTVNNTTLGLLSSGQFEWRVRVLTSAGWSNWMPTWTFTITAPPPVKPLLTQPINSTLLSDTTPEFIWGSVPDGQKYQVQIDDTSNFSSPARDVTLDVGILNYTLPEPLADGGKYYWRVRAINAAGVAGAWGGPYNFTLTQLASPVLLSLANNAVTAVTMPAFTWKPVLNAVSYEIQISTDTNFVTVNHTGSSATTGYTVPDPGLPGRVYYWRVRAIDSFNVAGKWSSKWKFTIDLTPPPAPVLSSPAANSGTPDTTPTLTWSAASTAKLYRIQITLSTDINFASPLWTRTSTTTNTTDPAPLGYNVYLWRVQAEDAFGNVGPYSPARHFAITLHKSPLNGATTTNPRPTFSWNGVTGATTYDFELDNNDNFNSPEWSKYATTSKSTAPTTTLLPGIYHWRVKANTTAWMPTWTVIITAPPPTRTVQVSPANNALLNDNTPTFTWNSVIGAAYYQIQIDNLSNFSSPEQDVQVVAPLTSYIASDLPDGKVYWRVRAINSTYGPGSWSSTRTLSIDTLPPAVPVITAPVNDTSMTNTKFNLAWNKVNDAARYEVQIDTVSTFLLPPIDVGNRTSYKPATPLARGDYFWHVRAVDKAGNVSAWADYRAFTIVAGITAGDLAPSATALPTAVPTVVPTEVTPTSTPVPVTVPPDLLLITLESDDPAVTQTGSWTAHDTPYASGGRYLYSSGGLADALTFSFSGTQLDVIYVQHPALGQFVVEVDGAPLLLADGYAAEAAFGVRQSIPLSAGPHTVRVYPLVGTIAIDAFIIQQTTIVPPVEPTVIPTEAPASEPTALPTGEPTLIPTVEPPPLPTSTPLPLLLPFGDSFDSGLGWIASGAWVFDNQTAHSGAGWWIDSTLRGQISTLTYIGQIDLHAAQYPQLGFWQRGVLSTADVLSIEVSLDGGLMWWPALRQSNISTDWTWQTVDLSAYRENVISLRFLLNTVDPLPDGAVTVGFGLDDLLIQDVPPTQTPVPTDLPTLEPTLEPTPLPTEQPTLVPTETPLPEPTLPPTEVPIETPTETGRQTT